MQEAHNDNFRTPAFADGYWVMFDYNRGYADDLELSGLMSIERMPKFAYCSSRASATRAKGRRASNPGPMVGIASFWTPKSTPKLRVFSNAEEVELTLNGRSLGQVKPTAMRCPSICAIRRSTSMPAGSRRARWSRPPLSAAAGWRRTESRTPEAVERHASSSSTTAGVCPEVDARDLVFVRARLVDRNGTTVPRSGRVVNFNAGEGLALVGSPSATTEAGIASVLARVTGKPGWRVTATSDAVGTEAALHGNRRLQDQKDDRGPAAIADSGSRTRAPARVANRLRSKYHINTF